MDPLKWMGAVRMNGLKLKHLNDGFVSYKHWAFHFTRCSLMDRSHVGYLSIIVMFLSAVWTLILTAPIHCRWFVGEQVMYFQQKKVLFLNHSSKNSCFGRIENEDNLYRLHISGFSGTVEDSFGWYHDKQSFSTPDTGDICAEISHGGWWYHQCFFANLNGVYYKVLYKWSKNETFQRYKIRAQPS